MAGASGMYPRGNAGRAGGNSRPPIDSSIQGATTSAVHALGPGAGKYAYDRQKKQMSASEQYPITRDVGFGMFMFGCSLVIMFFTYLRDLSIAEWELEQQALLAAVPAAEAVEAASEHVTTTT